MPPQQQNVLNQDVFFHHSNMLRSDGALKAGGPESLVGLRSAGWSANEAILGHEISAPFTPIGGEIVEIRAIVRPSITGTQQPVQLRLVRWPAAADPGVLDGTVIVAAVDSGTGVGIRELTVPVPNHIVDPNFYYGLLVALPEPGARVYLGSVRYV